ncbi:hypothetical protein TRVA0_041S00100 [Trichomonascus vanleenenianus]|uniref:Mpv17/PMP22 family protein n=1 Tax=Trichomonascus vanleenenianus TaxID=2268995 RepID=UPI003ECB5184
MNLEKPIDLESGRPRAPRLQTGRHVRTRSWYPTKSDLTNIPLVVVVSIQLTLVALCVFFFDNIYNASSVGASAVASSALAGLSQGLLQFFIEKRLQPASLLKFYVWGVVNGIWTKFWTDQLNSSFTSAGPKIFWDQFVGNPISIFLFISYSAYWDGHNVDRYLGLNYMKTLKASYVIWPLASAITFCLLPVEFIVPFNGVVNLIWTTILGLLPKPRKGEL